MEMASTTMTIRMDEEEKQLISDYAKVFGVSTSEFMRKSALERIEDELDLEDWKRAKAEFDADPETVPAAEVAKKYL
jgi:RHH-type rel operon transcriptional repressor/antitoxin RelB